MSLINGYGGLADRSHRPHITPRETPQETKVFIVNLRKKYKRMGAEQIKTVEDLTMNPKTIRKIWRDAGCSSRKRPKKHVTKNNLRAIKKAYKLFEHMGEDTKELNDIPEYYWQMKKHNLPQIQYTFREISCGILGLGFAQQKSLIHAQLFAIYINHFLKKYNALPSQSVRQTDNGSEYIGSWKAKESSIYTKAIESLDGQYHRTIYPGAHRMQSDVETIHNLMELEFYEIELFQNRLDFFNKATAYLLYFNLHRPNSYKEDKTPWQLAQEKNPGLDKRLLMIPPVDLDQLFAWYAPFMAKGGNNLLTVPSRISNFGNDTIDHYPPACGKVEKILCVSEKVFKKIQRDFEGFGIKDMPKPKSLIQKANKAQIKAPKTVKPASKPQPLPYGLMNKPNHFEPSNCIGNLDNTYRHRVGRLNDWHETYGQGMYE